MSHAVECELDSRRFEWLAWRRKRREQARIRIDRFLGSQTLSQRHYFRLSEIIDHCARPAGSLLTNPECRKELFELVRAGIYAGEFGGGLFNSGDKPPKPTRIRWISAEPLCPRWLPRAAAAPEGLSFSVIHELLISREIRLRGFGVVALDNQNG